jgi:hypothetical protein
LKNKKIKIANKETLSNKALKLKQKYDMNNIRVMNGVDHTLDEISLKTRSMLIGVEELKRILRPVQLNQKI